VVDLAIEDHRNGDLVSFKGMLDGIDCSRSVG